MRAMYEDSEVCIFVSLFMPGANPTIVSYNASSVKNYIAKSSLVLFENKVFFQFVKRSSLLVPWRNSCKLKSRRTGYSKNGKTFITK
jgi:hypothetical protein